MRRPRRRAPWFSETSCDPVSCRLPIVRSPLVQGRCPAILLEVKGARMFAVGTLRASATGFAARFATLMIEAEIGHRDARATREWYCGPLFRGAPPGQIATGTYGADMLGFNSKIAAVVLAMLTALCLLFAGSEAYARLWREWSSPFMG